MLKNVCIHKKLLHVSVLLFDYPQGAICRALCRYYNDFRWFAFFEYLLGMWLYVYVYVCLVLMSVEDLFLKWNKVHELNYKTRQMKFVTNS
jgi:hypothetical protein